MTASLLVALILSAQPPVPHPCAALDTAIPHAISLLEADDTETFIQTFARPDQLAKRLKTRSLQELSQAFSKEKSAALVQSLKSIRGVAAKMNDEGTIAGFPLPGSVTEKMIVFRRIKDRWYLDN